MSQGAGANNQGNRVNSRSRTMSFPFSSEDGRRLNSADELTKAPNIPPSSWLCSTAPFCMDGSNVRVWTEMGGVVVPCHIGSGLNRSFKELHYISIDSAAGHHAVNDKSSTVRSEEH